MIGSSRESFAALRNSLAERRNDPAFGGLSQELLSVAAIVGADNALRTALADAGQPGAAKAGMVSDLFGQRLSGLAVEILSSVASARWTSGSDMLDALEGLGAQAAFLAADNAGELDQVEDELYAVRRAIGESAELQMALTNAAIADADKAKVVSSLLSGKTSETTAQVCSYALSHLRGRRVDSTLEGLGAIAAEQRGRSVAEVRTIVALDDSQQQRLSGALSKIFGRPIRLNLSVDPSVVGGVAVRVGDQIIDGTISSRLAQAQRSVVGQ